MKVVIVEDEALAAKYLAGTLARLETGIEVVAQLAGVAEAVAWFKANAAPDLAFFDIQLSDGVSFDIFDQVELKCPVIFTTAYDEYALRAFKVNSVDYLLKPIEDVELKRALDKYRHLYQPPPDQESRVQHLLEALRNPGSKRYKERFLVRSLGAHLLVPTAEVAYMMKDELVYLITMDNKRYVTDYNTMDELEDLVNPLDFFRANRQFIVRLGAVESLKNSPTGKLNVKLKAPMNAMVDVSREKAPAFRAWIG